MNSIQPASGQHSPQEYIQMGLNEDLEGRTDSAFLYFSAAIQREPTNRDALFFRAQLISNHPNLNQNLGLSDAMRLMDPQNAALALRIQCKIYMNIDQPDRVLTMAAMGLAFASNDPVFLLYRAKAYLQFTGYAGYQSRFSLAEEDLTRLLALNPDNLHECLFLRAQAYLGQKKFDQAFDDLALVLESPLKEQARPLINQAAQKLAASATALLNGGKTDEAFLKAMTILTAIPDHNEANLLLAKINAALNNQASSQ